MASPNPHHPDGHPDPDPAFHLHPPASHQPQPSYQPQPPQNSSPSHSHSPQSSTLHLPTSRQFLTSLITAISNIPLLNEPPAAPAPAPAPTKTQQRDPPSISGTTEATEAEEGAAEIITQKKRKQLLQILKEEGDEAKGHIATRKKDGPGGGEGGGGWKGNPNPLKLVPPEYRHLIITLHVLFPGVVLSGLEVLERGLVERVVLRCAAGEAAVVKKEGGQKERKEQKEQKKEVDGDVDVDVDVIMGEEDDGEDYRDENQGRDEDGDGDGDKKNEEKAKKPSESQQGLKGERRRPPPPEFYLVRSSQFLNTHPRRKRKKPSSNLVGLGDAADTEGVQPGGSETDRDRDHRIQRYIVSLEAWNCTCAAFAFACVSEEPEVGEAGGDGDEDGEEQGSEELREREKERVRDKQGSAGWTFGGMTLFNPDDHSSVPPVCKHLLACLLADKWRRALGRYVTERMMSREEMAGIVADV